MKKKVLAPDDVPRASPEKLDGPENQFKLTSVHPLRHCERKTRNRVRSNNLAAAETPNINDSKHEQISVQLLA